MKINTYDALINNVRAIFFAGIIFIFFAGILYAVMFAIENGLKIFFDHQLATWIFHTIPLIVSTPITFLLWASLNAHPQYNVKFRDFWVKFAVYVEVEIKTSDMFEEITDWLETNTTSLSREIGTSSGLYTYAFLSKEDAVAFKLRWI